MLPDADGPSRVLCGSRCGSLLWMSILSDYEKSTYAFSETLPISMVLGLEGLFKNHWLLPWPVWLGGLGVVPQSKMSPVRFSVRAHVCLVVSVPSWGTYERQLIDVSLSHRYFSPSLSPSHPLSLKIIKVIPVLSLSNPNVQDRKS